MADEISEYRAIRVLIYPRDGLARVSVVCRVVHRGRARDVALGPPGGWECALGPDDSVSDVLRAASRALAAVADSI